MSSASIEPCNNLAILIFSNRKLCLVSVSPRLIHSNYRFHDAVDKRLIKSAQSDNIVSYLTLFKLKLFFIRHILCLAATTGSGNRTFSLHSVHRRSDNFLKMCIGIVLLGLHYLGAYNITYYRIFNKEGIAIYLAYALSVISYICYFYCQKISLVVFHVFSFFIISHTYYPIESNLTVLTLHFSNEVCVVLPAAQALQSCSA